MKKRIILIVVLLFVVVGVVYFTVNVNEDIEIDIEHIKLTEVSEIDRKFSYYEWSDEIRKEIKENPLEYVSAEILYTVNNKNERISMCDVRYELKIENELKSMIQVYNTDNGNHIMCVRPQSSTGLQQNIIIKRNGKTLDEIEVMLNETKMVLKYSPCIGEGDTGHGKWYFSDKKYEINIKDVLKQGH